jgi:hypothetical protein
VQEDEKTGDMANITGNDDAKEKANDAPPQVLAAISENTSLLDEFQKHLYESLMAKSSRRPTI